MARFELEVHYAIGKSIHVDFWYTDEGYSVSRNKKKVVLNLVNGADSDGLSAEGMSYQDCFRVVIREQAVE